MQDTQLNIALIGAGHFARTHYRTLSKIPSARIVAACDINEAMLRETCDQFGIRGRYTDYRKLLDNADGIDAVYVILPPLHMFPIAMDVIAAGKHIFSEKPLGSKLEETAALADAVAKAGLKSAVGCNRRYCAVLRKAKEVVAAEGEISGVFAEYHKDCGPKTLYNISILQADGLHAIDAMRYLGGDVVEVHAHSDRWYRKSGWEGLNNVFHAMVRFENGATGVYVANRQGGCRREVFEVHGRDISAYIFTPDRAEIYRAGIAQPEILTGEALTGSTDPLMTYGYYHESVGFIDAVLNDRQPETNFADNLKTMRLCKEFDNGEHLERAISE